MPRKLKPPTTEAQFWVKLICECPACGERIDLWDMDELDPDDLPEACVSQETEIKVSCPACEISFIVAQVTY